MPTPQERLEALARGENPNLVAHLGCGYLVLSDEGYLPGYCLLLADPLAPALEELDHMSAMQFMEQVFRVGATLKELTGAKRINYGIYGNVDPFLHCHLWPRYEWEEAPFATMPPLAWPAERRAAEAEKHLEAHLALRQRLEDFLT